MRKILAGVGLFVSGLFSLVFVAPLLRAMQRDREERNRIDALDQLGDCAYPYDDDDPGADVDDHEAP